MVVGSLFVVDVDHVDLLHLAPGNAPAVKVGDAVGRQIGDFDAVLLRVRLLFHHP